MHGRYRRGCCPVTSRHCSMTSKPASFWLAAAQSPTSGGQQGWQAWLPLGRMGEVGLLGTAGWSLGSIPPPPGVRMLASDQPTKPEQ